MDKIEQIGNKKEGVMTTKGLIKYMTHPSGKFQMPVLCKPAKNVVTSGPRPPLLIHGCLVFAMPGGEEFISFYTVDNKDDIR